MQAPGGQKVNYIREPTHYPKVGLSDASFEGRSDIVRKPSSFAMARGISSIHWAWLMITLGYISWTGTVKACIESQVANRKTLSLSGNQGNTS